MSANLVLAYHDLLPMANDSYYTSTDHNVLQRLHMYPQINLQEIAFHQVLTIMLGFNISSPLSPLIIDVFSAFCKNVTAVSTAKASLPKATHHIAKLFIKRDACVSPESSVSNPSTRIE